MANLSMQKFNAAMNMKEKREKNNVLRQEESNKRWKEVEERKKKSSNAIAKLSTTISKYGERVNLNEQQKINALRKTGSNTISKVGAPKRLEDEEESVPVASTSQPSISYGPNHQPFTGLNFEPATAELEQHQLHINNLARNTRALQERINQRSKARHAKREQAAAAEFASM
jgi:hypothetical protein